jgi:nucleoside-diphosphate-sugar epimerase
VSNRTLIVGAGYVGGAYAHSLKSRGENILCWVSSEASRQRWVEQGFECFAGDVASEENWEEISSLKFDRVLFCVSTSGGGAEAYLQIHQTGLDLALKYSSPESKFIYTSSTSVYGQSHGELVDEDSPTQPSSETGKILVEAEKKVLRHGGVVLRLSGIYGPGRGVLFQKMMEGTATIDQVFKGENWINQIHLTDILGAIDFIDQREWKSDVYNVTDDEPVKKIDFFKWISATFDKQMPPFTDEKGVKKRGLTNKRVSNEKLRIEGWKMIYPTYKTGYLDL